MTELDSNSPANGLRHGRKAAAVWVPAASSSKRRPKSCSPARFDRAWVPTAFRLRVARDFEVQFSGIFGRVAAHVAGAPINVVNPEVLGKWGLKRRSYGIFG